MEMKKRFCIFGGTSEGRRLCEIISSQNGEADLYVATEYGESLNQGLKGITVVSHRMEVAEMEALFARGGYAAVIDATHPFACIVSENIVKAAASADVCLMRVVRQPEHYDDCIYFSSASECAEFLNLRSGKVLLTTGSKDLDIFASVRGFKERMYPRVLPVEDSLRRCLDLGYLNKNIICMQGPFTRELNRAMLNQIGAACMVTKETAEAGGYGEKVEACRDAGVSCLVISMPAEKGLKLSEAEAWLRANIGDKE